MDAVDSDDDYDEALDDLQWENVPDGPLSPFTHTLEMANLGDGVIRVRVNDGPWDPPLERHVHR